MSQTANGRPETSIAIAGGGIIGMSLGWRLAQKGWRVTVFDAGQIGGEASWAGAGMLSLGGEIEEGSPLATLAITSRALYKQFVLELEKASGIAIDFQECGALDVAYSADEFQTLDRRASAQARLGISSKPVSADRVSMFWPRIQTSGLMGARFYPDDAIVNPREVMAALEVACRKSDVEMVPSCAVTHVEIGRAGTNVVSARGARSYSATVIAAGAWSSSIEMTGVAPLPIAEPVKGHLIGYAQPEQTCHTIIRHGHTYLFQRANGLLIAGASVEHAGFDRTIDPEIAAQLAKEASRLFPHLGETAPTETWTGFRPGGEALHIGAWHSERLYLAYGHYRNGILLAPITAQILSAEISANLETR